VSHIDKAELEAPTSDGRIAVGVDGSPEGERALDRAFS
jgi:hypothetical protein